MSMEFPPNVVNSIGEPLDAYGETVFLSRLFKAMELQMGDDFKRFTFVVHRRIFGEFAGKPINLDQGGPERVLILIADEREVFPCQEFLSYRQIFRSYGVPPSDSSQIHAFPVGYLNAAGLVEAIPFADRDISVFFSGYLNRNRIDIFKQFRPTWWLPMKNLPKNKYIRELARRAVDKLTRERDFLNVIPSSRIGFTEWFGKGLPPEEYAKILARTRIAICPPGFESHETIRHWEAMRLGCVVISAPLPKNRFYAESPIIQLEDWSELKPLISRLMANPDELHALHEKTLEWWHRRCSEPAVANYMAEILAQKTADNHAV